MTSTDKLKSITKKLLIFLLALTFLVISPSKTAEAKSIEMTKYVNKTAEQLVSMLKLKPINNDNPLALEYLYSKNGKNIIPVGIGVIPGYENTKGCWTVYLTKKDRGITAYGLKPKTSRKKVHKVLSREGWKCTNGSKWTDKIVEYTNSKGQSISINYNNSKQNAKINSIYYSPATSESYGFGL